MRRLRLVGLTFVVLCTTGALFATSALALPFEFKAETYPVVEKSLNTNIHGFSIDAGQLISLCETAKFNTGEGGAANPTSDSTEIKVHPVYENCHISVAGLGNSAATVESTGCNYKLVAKKPSTTGGIVKVECEAGKALTVVDNTVPTCKTKVTTQELKGTEYVNEGAGSGREVKVGSEVEKIKWTTEGCGIATSGTDGIYRQGKLKEGLISEIEPAGHPAFVKTKGETEAKAADGVEVGQVAPHYYINGTGAGNLLAEGAKIATMSWGTLTLTPAAPSKEGTTSCENGAGGFIENPVGGGAGTGQASVFLSWNCAKPTSCPNGAEIEFPTGSGKKVQIEADIFPGGELGTEMQNVLGESFPWPILLTENEGTKIRQETKGVVEILGCAVKKSVEGSAPLGDGDKDSPQFVKKLTVCFTNPLAGATSEPLAENGTQVGGPLTSKLNFNAAGAGHVLCKGEGEGGTEIEFTGNVTGTIKSFTYEGQEIIDTH